MSPIITSDHAAVLVRAADAERIGFLLVAEGDLAVVPPGLPHAFAAAEASDADLLIVITPGIERFEYFRHLARVATGQQSSESLLEVQARYDTFFDDSPAWQRARNSTPSGS